MERRFTVLSDEAEVFPSDPFRGAGPSTSSARLRGRGAGGLQVDVADLGKRELRDVVRSPRTRAVAPVIPTRLVFPVGDGDFAAAEGCTGPTWGVRAVGADVSSRTGAGVTVAVLDTGIDAAHPAFTGMDLVQKDFSGDGDGDVQGHGTHCAGTVFGRDVDGVRIGVAPGVNRALIGKVLGDEGGGSSDMIFRGIQWAVQEGAAVVSMSLGFDFPGYVSSLVSQGWPADLATSVALEGYRANLRMFDALMGVVDAGAAFGPGAVLVAASGNESRRDIHAEYEIAVSIPAAAEGMVSVGALQESDSGLRVADFSNTFPSVAAPGVGVLSAAAGTSGLVSFNGTSMATPHVAGVAALWWEEVAESGLLPKAETVRSRMMANADLTRLADDFDLPDGGVGLVRAPVPERMRQRAPQPRTSSAPATVKTSDTGALSPSPSTDRR